MTYAEPITDSPTYNSSQSNSELIIENYMPKKSTTKTKPGKPIYFRNTSKPFLTTFDLDKSRNV